MGALADKLGNKGAGELIRAKDWNDLVAAIEEIDSRLSGKVADLTTRVGGLDTRMSAAEGRIGALEAQTAALKATVDQLQARFRRVTLRTPQSTYALGATAELVVQVADLAGNALDLSNPANRPWIDFVTSWGQFKPAPGFETLGGEGNRTLSVRVNQSGEARALLRADYVGKVTPQMDDAMEALMSVKLADNSGDTVMSALLKSDTPQEANQRGTYRIVSKEYDRELATGVRGFIDQYYLHDPGRLFDPVGGITNRGWRDYRTTVLAFAKLDADPQTPDASLGTASMQITFRDWIPSWFDLDYYVLDRPAIKADLLNRVKPLLGVDFTKAFGASRDEIVNVVKGKGQLKKLATYRALDDALDELTTPAADPYLPQYRTAMKSALSLQQSFDRGVSSDTPVAFQSFTDGALHAQAQAAGAKQEAFDLVNKQVSDATNQINGQVRKAQETFRDELLSDTGAVVTLQRNVTEISSTFGKLKGLDATNVSQQLSFLGGLENRIKALEVRR